MKKILVIGGFDPSAGAGVLADIAVLSELGVYGAAAITCLTAQNSREGDILEPVGTAALQRQIEVLMEDIEFDAAKIGLVPDDETATAIAAVLRSFKKPVVFDPVRTASSGALLSLLDGDELPELLRIATIVTPNRPELTEMTGIPAADGGEERAIESLRLMGARGVFLTGGHTESEKVTDILIDQDGRFDIEHERIKTRPVRGTGCMLSSALTVYLALGYDNRGAAERAVRYVERKIFTAQRIGKGAPQATFLGKEPPRV